MPIVTFEESLAAFRNPGKGWRIYTDFGGPDETPLASSAHTGQMPLQDLYLGWDTFDWTTIDDWVQTWGVEKGYELSLGINGLGRTGVVPDWLRAELAAASDLPLPGLPGAEFDDAGIWEPEYRSSVWLAAMEDFTAGFRAAWDAKPAWRAHIKEIGVKLYGSGGGEWLSKKYPWQYSQFGVRPQIASGVTGGDLVWTFSDFTVSNLGAETSALDPPTTWEDDFDRTAVDGWGHAPTGRYAPDDETPAVQVPGDGTGTVTLHPGTTLGQRITCDAASEDEIDAKIAFRISRLPTGGETFCGYFGRRRQDPYVLNFPTVIESSVYAEDAAAAPATSHPVPLPVGTGILADDIVIGWLALEGTTSVTWPAGWTVLKNALVNGEVRISVAWKRMAGGETGDVAVTSASATRGTAQMRLIRYASTSSAPEVGGTTNNTGADTANPAAFEPSWNVIGPENTLWFGCAIFDGYVDPDTIDIDSETWGDPLSSSASADAPSAAATISLTRLGELVSTENPPKFLHPDLANMGFVVAVRPVTGAGAATFSSYSARVIVGTDGLVQLLGRKAAQDVESNVAGRVTGGSVSTHIAANEKWWVRWVIDQRSPTRIRAKVWKDGEAEPASWTLDRTEGTVAKLQEAIGDEHYQTTRPLADVWPDAMAGAESEPDFEMVAAGSKGFPYAGFYERDPAAMRYALEIRGMRGMFRRNIGQRTYDSYLAEFPDEPAYWAEQADEKYLNGEWGTHGFRMWLTGHALTGSISVHEGVVSAARFGMGGLGWWVNHGLSFKVSDIPTDFDVATWFPEALPYWDPDSPDYDPDHLFTNTDPLMRNVIPDQVPAALLRSDSADETLRDFFQRNAGYRFYVAQITYPSALTPEAVLRCDQTWYQRGQGKLYRHYGVRARLVGLVTVELEVDDSLDAETWAPGPSGPHAVSPAWVIPAETPLGNYELQFAVVDEDGAPAINLAIDGKVTEGLGDPINDPGWYSVGVLGVVRPSLPAVPKERSGPSRVVARTEVSGDFQTAITASHRLATLARVLRDGVIVEKDIPLLDGSVTQDARAAIRSRCDVTLVDDGTLGLVPEDPNDPLAPYGNEIQLARGIRYPDGSREMVSLGIFRIDETEGDDSGEDLELRINGQDRSAGIADAKFEEPYQVDAGTLFTEAILAVVKDAYPDVVYRFAATSIQTPALIAEEGDDRWAFVQGLAKALGAELYFDSSGVLVLAPVPSAGDDAPPDLELEEGEGGILLDASRRWSRIEAFNRVIATGENTGQGAPIPRGVATDKNPLSPTYYYGPFGKVPHFWSSEFITSDDQASDAAEGILAAQLGATQPISFGSLVIPTLAASDVVKVTRERIGINEIHVVDSLTIPLTAEGTMSGVTRATQVG